MIEKHAMTGKIVKVAIGIGSRKETTAAAIVALTQRALARVEQPLPPLRFLCGLAGKESPALSDAAQTLGLPLLFFPLEALRAQNAGAATRSARVVELFGVPSIAETAALAGAGEGARLIVARMAGDGATCAIAALEEKEAL